MAKPKNLDPQVAREKFGNNLKLEMIYNRISIRALAKKTGVSVSAIVSYRAGKKDASVSRIYSLAKGIGIPAGQLFEE